MEVQSKTQKTGKTKKPPGRDLNIAHTANSQCAYTTFDDIGRIAVICLTITSTPIYDKFTSKAVMCEAFNIVFTYNLVR